MASELELIDAFLAAFPKAPVPVGPGDDCAVLPRREGQECVTTDALFEGVHFTRPHFSMEDVGHKALAVNLSDLASMGARPTWFVCALGLPRRAGLGEVKRLAAGMSALARAHRIALVGGNFSAARELSVTITAAGEVEPGRALLRSGARPGDLLYVSGTLGEAAMGLAQLGRARGGLPEPALVLRQRRPEPRISLGLLASRFATAAIDVSDGFARDLDHLCRASRCAAEVELGRLPLSPALLRAAGGRTEAERWALGGGEDYELVLAIPPARAEAFERACRRAAQRVTGVGRLLRGRGLRLLGASGRRVAAPGGFDHFRPPPRPPGGG